MSLLPAGPVRFPQSSLGAILTPALPGGDSDVYEVKGLSFYPTLNAPLRYTLPTIPIYFSKSGPPINVPRKTSSVYASRA